MWDRSLKFSKSPSHKLYEICICVVVCVCVCAKKQGGVPHLGWHDVEGTVTYEGWRENPYSELIQQKQNEARGDCENLNPSGIENSAEFFTKHVAVVRGNFF